MDDQTTLLVKIGGAAAFGAAVSLKFIPGNWWQRGLSFAASLGIGCLAGGAAAEYYSIPPGSVTHMAAIAAAAVFGLSGVSAVIQKIPGWIDAARQKFLGS
ncbi:hypothetical protein [Pandoraea terrigena]|uniref:Holin n=1 Tax=Pandoraea terrigena TaxID=2508292 RepID=A0A5E4VA62_9BURK|nr:hypothetical protein [Pandoraea terrigena]VVE07790.1 hypothetical protein PTE31013_02482 [Pandoraea terrigena]